MNGTAYTAPSDQMGIRSIHNRGRGLLGYIRADNFDHLSSQHSNYSFCKSDRAYSEWVEGMGVGGALRTLRIGLLGLSASRNKPAALEFISNPPDLGVDIPNLLYVSLGPSSVFRVRCCDPRFAFRGPWSGGLAPMHPTSVASSDDWVLAGGTFTRFSVAPLARPTGPEPRITARVDEFFTVN